MLQNVSDCFFLSFFISLFLIPSFSLFFSHFSSVNTKKNSPSFLKTLFPSFFRTKKIYISTATGDGTRSPALLSSKSKSVVGGTDLHIASPVQQISETDPQNFQDNCDLEDLDPAGQVAVSDLDEPFPEGCCRNYDEEESS